MMKTNINLLDLNNDSDILNIIGEKVLLLVSSSYRTHSHGSIAIAKLLQSSLGIELNAAGERRAAKWFEETWTDEPETTQMPRQGT